MVDEDKLESIFATVLPLTSDKRAAYLEDACGEDTELRERVDSLLKASEAAGSFFDKLPAAFMPTIATGQGDTVDEAAGEISLDFLTPSDKPNCLGTLGQYEVIEVVGQGGMGLVLRAHDTKLDRIVAIKVMAPELAANPMAAKRFLREARAAAAVSHGHVVSIFAIHDDNKPPYIVMEFVDGQSLQEKIDQQGALDVTEILRIGMQIARGLSAAHEQGLVHRDIKPANILLENGVERVKLTDFGLARAVDDVSVTQTGQIAGTPQFMSPEQAQGHSLDARSDLFSLGSLLYTMCTGRPPFRAETAVAMLRRVTDDDPRPIGEVNSEIPDWLEAITFKLLAKVPTERFQSADEVSKLLSQHLAHLQHPGTVPQPATVEMPRLQQPSFDLDEELGSVESTLRIYGWVAIMWAVPAIIFALLVYAIPGNYTASFFRLNAPWALGTGVVSLITGLLAFVGMSNVRRRDSYGKAVVGSVAALLPANPFLVPAVPVSIWSIFKLRNPKIRPAFQPATFPTRSWPRVETASAIIGCLAMFLIAGILIYVKSDYGTIRVEVNDPNTVLTVDGKMGINVQKSNGGKLTVRAGHHKLHIKQGDLEFETDTFRIRRGEEVVLGVEFIEGQLGARLKPSDRVIGLQRDGKATQEFAIRTSHGKYWRFAGENQPVLTDAEEVGATETFTFEWRNADRTRAYVRTPDDLYVRGVPDSRQEFEGWLLTNDERGGSEEFFVEWIDRQKRTCFLRTRNHGNVSVSPEGYLTTSRSFSKAETFTLVPRDSAPSSEPTTNSRIAEVGRLDGHADRVSSGQRQALRRESGSTQQSDHELLQ